MSTEPIFMHLDSTDTQVMSRGNRGCDPAKHSLPLLSPSAQREAASKDPSRMQVRRLVILVDESKDVESFPAPGCRLFDGCICLVCLRYGRVCRRHA